MSSPTTTTAADDDTTTTAAMTFGSLHFSQGEVRLGCDIEYTRDFIAQNIPVFILCPCMYIMSVH